MIRYVFKQLYMYKHDSSGCGKIEQKCVMLLGYMCVYGKRCQNLKSNSIIISFSN